MITTPTKCARISHNACLCETFHRVSASFLAITVYAGDSPISGHDGTACSNKSKGVVNAIGKFCQSKKIYVNGAYASNGMW